MQSKITALCRQNFGELSPVSVANTLWNSAVNVNECECWCRWYKFDT